MIGLGNGALKIYLAPDPCDMRKSFNGLYDIVASQLETSRLTCCGPIYHRTDLPN